MADNVDARPRATLLLTRPRAASESFAAEIAGGGLPLDIVISPLMEIVDRLRAAGHDAAAHVVYDQVALRPNAAFTSALARDRLIVPLFSPRSASLFSDAAQPDWRPGSEDLILALSAAVRDALPPEWADRCRVVEKPHGVAMRDAIARLIFP
jgi:uroporphyrinogen-III synthase